MRISNTLLMMLGIVITGASADCLSTNGKEYPFGTYTCDGEHKIVQCTVTGNWTLIATCGGTCTFVGSSPYCP
ncbi:hypothetical protein VC83_03563 [Pseudogymnoascus destructans]|uniref:Chitin-binding type-2 domain-containing protein n=1 Tax=Pseudogymnoascus destructans TaxID=655981 RepID=A0A177AEP0_9PEZI|nr:uncharacterized protein VC83_03563 [Pseudogymnoascus destructans]OAF60575.1 hypothetical protein VC83_03563 [Pseudogymnoascus destructans]